MFTITPEMDGTPITDVSAADIDDALADLYTAGGAVSLRFATAREDTGGHLCASCAGDVEETTAPPYWRHVEPEHPAAPSYCPNALAGLVCRHCAEDIEPARPDTDHPTGWIHRDPDPLGDVGPRDHFAEPDPEDLAQRPTATPSPLDWLNSARVTIDADEDAVHLAVSTGTPLGAHVFTVRRVMPDDGPPSILLHTPYPGDSAPHSGLLPVFAGTYREAEYPAGADLVPVWLTADERATIVRALAHAGPPADTIAAKIERAS